MSWREKIRGQQTQRRANHLWRTRTNLQSAQGVRVIVDGRPFDNFCSNDYLGLAHHPQVIEASVDALRRFGTGSGASHLICGHHELHHELENALANFVGAEKAIVFSTGYMANLAIPQAFLQEGDFLFQDRLNHASLLDAGRNCGARMTRYAHCDPNSLTKRLQKTAIRVQDGHKENGSRMILTDGVFSMNGSIAPLNELKTIADQHNALLVVDDAHGFGVLGHEGRGSLDSFDLKPESNVLMMGTLGKAMGSFGAFVAGDKELIEQLIQFGRTYIYTTALPPQVVAASLAAIRVLQEDPNLVLQLHDNIKSFRETFSQHSPDEAFRMRLAHSPTPIQPVLIGDSQAALEASRILKDAGVMVSAIRPPTVAKDTSRLRITLSAKHQSDQIETLVSILCSDEMTQRISCPPTHGDRETV